MKDINEILRKKEVDLQQLHREVDALRIVARLLSEETDATVYPPRTVAANPYAPPPRPAPPLSVSANAPGLGASWDAAAKKFP
jgi:hypothetical protein